jgi:hypothetical protein
VHIFKVYMVYDSLRTLTALGTRVASVAKALQLPSKNYLQFTTTNAKAYIFNK